MSVKKIEKYFESIKNVTPEKKEEWISKIDKFNKVNDKAVLLFEDESGKISWTMASKAGDKIHLSNYGVECAIDEIDNVFKGHKCVGVAGSTQFSEVLKNASVGVKVKTSTNFLADKYKEQYLSKQEKKQFSPKTPKK